MGDLKTSVQALEPLLVYYPTDREEDLFNQLFDFLLHQIRQQAEYYIIENVVNGCVYELYFGEEMKKGGVDILTFVEKDLEEVANLKMQDAIVKLYSKWQQPNNEVRNRLLLMPSRCTDTIGVIESCLQA